MTMTAMQRLIEKKRKALRRERLKAELEQEKRTAKIRERQVAEAQRREMALIHSEALREEAQRESNRLERLAAERKRLAADEERKAASAAAKRRRVAEWAATFRRELGALDRAAIICEAHGEALREDRLREREAREKAMAPERAAWERKQEARQERQRLLNIVARPAPFSPWPRQQQEFGTYPKSEAGKSVPVANRPLLKAAPLHLRAEAQEALRLAKQAAEAQARVRNEMFVDSRYRKEAIRLTMGNGSAGRAAEMNRLGVETDPEKVPDRSRQGALERPSTRAAVGKDTRRHAPRKGEKRRRQIKVTNTAMGVAFKRALGE